MAVKDVIMGAAGGAGGSEKMYVEDVFSTYLYTGNGSTQTINNGVDLAGKGGMIWQKVRSSTGSSILTDTNRGNGYILTSNSTAAQSYAASVVSSFNSDGFTDAGSQANGASYASWTFRKQPKFFDVVTFTTDASGNAVVPHSLGSVPGCVIIKNTQDANNWMVYHRSLTSTNFYLTLNTTDAQGDVGTTWINPTSTNVSFVNNIQYASRTYVAYLFAHDAGGFGLSGNENVVSCGSYVGNDSTDGPTINLGYEPQWVMIKNTATGGAGNDWLMADNMRGIPMSGNTLLLSANLSSAETGGSQGHALELNPTGFKVTSPYGALNSSSNTYIYIAIRRGPMKVPTDGTKVFSPNVATTQILTNTVLPSAGFPVDLMFFRKKDDAYSTYWNSRLLPDSNLQSDSTSAEITGYPYGFDSMTGVKKISNNWYNGSAVPFVFWQFRRAPSFFDEVCYTGTGANRTVTHNLAAVPELMITKPRSGAYGWLVYTASTGATKYMLLNDTGAAGVYEQAWNNTAPTATQFTVGTTAESGGLSGGTYVAYLFATCAGVSKVGSYTGTGTTQAIACGFAAGARFVMIKRTDAAGDWYVWDSARGIVAGNDPYMRFNTSAAEVTGTDYIDPSSAGFEISSTAPAEINASGGTYIFLAIA